MANSLRIGVPLAAATAVVLGRALARRRAAMDLTERVALIFGGSRGLGLLLARELARRGARLALGARDPEELERARSELQQRGAVAIAVPCDVRDQVQVERAVARVEDEFGRIDVLVNDAGIITVGPEPSQTLEDYRAAMGVMFWGPLYATMAALPGMRSRGEGRIVNIASIGGKVSIPHLLPYSAAKFALVGYSEGLRAELAREGIAVVTVIPGLMRTGSQLNASFKGKYQDEYALFRFAATSPLTAMDAHRAARQIVDATARGDAEVILSIQAQVLARAHGLAPGVTGDVLGLINRFLPGAGGDGHTAVPGRDVSPAPSPADPQASGTPPDTNEIVRT